jgi:hypothetical protein
LTGRQGYKLIEGGNVTVIQGTKETACCQSTSSASVLQRRQQLAWTAARQKNGDSDARQILESELKKAETRQAELRSNNSEPDKRAAKPATTKIH